MVVQKEDIPYDSCMICTSNKRIVIDHCHETGKVRGILCTNCNTVIAKLGDNKSGIQKALNYLKQNNDFRL